jgi:hypothetical protein
MIFRFNFIAQIAQKPFQTPNKKSSYLCVTASFSSGATRNRTVRLSGSMSAIYIYQEDEKSPENH